MVLLSWGRTALGRLALATTVLFLLISCGSGDVGTPPVNDPSRITIQPNVATLYSGLPTTLLITGGTGSYVVSSSNQAVIEVESTVNSGRLTIVPKPVGADTVVTLTVRDTGTTAPANATLTVRPGTVNNEIAIVPGSSACAPAVCSGGDAVVRATLSQGGNPLPLRGVRFEVVSGDFRFVTSPAGAPETLGLAVETATDEAGVARARLRVLNTAANQVAILQVTDLATGAFQRTTLFIARASATQAGFFTVPTEITFTGPTVSRCGSGSADVFVFGGTPPYTVSNTAPDALSVSPVVVTSSGGRFTVTAHGTCLENVAIAVTDGAARTTAVTVSSRAGTAPDPPFPMVVSPTSVTLSSCNGVASVVAAAGSGTYAAGSNNSLVLATASGSVVSISRASGNAGGTGQPGSLLPGFATVTVTDGSTFQTVQVSLRDAATGVCP